MTARVRRAMRCIASSRAREELASRKEQIPASTTPLWRRLSEATPLVGRPCQSRASEGELSMNIGQHPGDDQQRRSEADAIALAILKAMQPSWRAALLAL